MDVKIFIFIIGILLIIGSIAGWVLEYIVFGFPWERDVESYYDLAWDASTLEEKTKHLKRFLNELERRELNEGQSVLIFKTPHTDMKEQYKLLEALVERMEEGLKMDKNSLEYQYLMRQIEENEIDYIQSGIFSEDIK